MKQFAAKLLYGALFVLALPLLLIAWAQHTRSAVTLPAVHSLTWGIATAAAGLLIMVLGMWALWTRGGGLPMNAFPPTHYVSSGIYRLLSHPIYVGFGAVCVGVSLAAGSASGLWLVCPTVILASTALVLGYEWPDLHKRFGGTVAGQHLFPPDDHCAPTPLERIRCYVTILLPWLLLYEACVAIGVPIDAKPAYLPFEQQWPVLPWTGIFYFSVYVVVPAFPLLVRTRHELRRFSLSALVSMLIVFPIYLSVPLISPLRASAPDTALGRLLIFDRAHDTPAAAFPSYHVIWAFVVVSAISSRRRAKWLGRLWATMVALSCLMTGVHALVDVLAALVVVWVVVRAVHLWSSLRRISETIANSWREWRIGPLRIINHGLYAALAVFVGVEILDTLLGPGRRAIPVAIFVGGTVAAALWAQWIEGSPALLRPLGFYGGVIGTITGGILAARFLHASVWLVLAALAVAAAWIQGIGRLRCLVQGCCHGRPTHGTIGIRYSHPQSRVSRISELRGIPLHPTPLYSILWNVLVAMVVARLYFLHANAAMVGGVYLILSGVGRFAEEAYRGEPQTRIIAGLRLYQWLAIASVIIGAFVTTVSTAPKTPLAEPHASSLIPALACAMLAWFVTGMDFPESNRRFARLT